MNYSLPEIKFDVKFLQKFLQSNILLYCVVLLLALKIVTVFVSINIPQNIFFADITKATLENFVNQTRQSFGLQPLVDNQKLDQAAQLKAENMVANNYFAHTSPTGVTPWYWFLQAGYNYKYAGENLAIGFFDSEEVYNAWLNSPSHKANIVNPNYKEIGTAVLKGFGSNNAIVVVQEFGTVQQAPLPVKQVAAQPKTQPVVKTNEPAPAAGTNEKVLSQSTESNVAIENAKTGSSNVYYKIMSSVLYDYDGWLQDVIYGVSLVVIGLLLALIFFNFNFEFKKELVFRSVLIVILLSLATLLNKEFIISIIPHQIII
ncbi:MAG: CAP domain-containing protein [Candidatus Staskawiczbacteria bacterium]|jgi:hypothetical protein